MKSKRLITTILAAAMLLGNTAFAADMYATRGEVAAGLENPDYKALYRSMARAWASTRTREYAQYAASVDLHSDEKLRVNRVVVNCEEFYNAFDIKEGDGMYVPEDERVKIW